MRLTSLISAIVLCLLSSGAHASFVSLDDEFGIEARVDSLHAAFLNHRREAIPDILCPFQAPPKARIVQEEPTPWSDTRHRWHRGMNATPPLTMPARGTLTGRLITVEWITQLSA
jgi:hypothetical protein